MSEKPEIALIENSTKRQHFTDVRHVTVRWEPYKPDGARQMKRKGRWQEMVITGDYHRWQNCDRPEFAHEPDQPYADLVRAALIEAIRQAKETQAECAFFDEEHGGQVLARLIDILDQLAANETAVAAIVASVTDP
jgi:hypothetical protein